jgi:hypothetical protein
MKHSAIAFLAALVLGIGAAGCSKEQNEAETANAPNETTAANETAANESGTTTYYGSPEEQAQN